MIKIMIFLGLISSAMANPTFYNDQIDISGVYEEKKAPTEAERLKEVRAQIEEQTNNMVDQKIQSMRLKRELEMTKRLQQVFEQQMKAIDKF